MNIFKKIKFIHQKRKVVYLVETFASTKVEKFCEKQLSDELLTFIFNKDIKNLGKLLDEVIETQVLPENVQYELLKHDYAHLLFDSKEILPAVQKVLTKEFYDRKFTFRDYDKFLNRHDLTMESFFNLFLGEPSFIVKNYEDKNRIYEALTKLTPEQCNTFSWDEVSRKHFMYFLHNHVFFSHLLDYSLMKNLIFTESAFPVRTVPGTVLEKKLNDFGENLLKTCLKTCHLTDLNFKLFESTFLSFEENWSGNLHDLIEACFILGPDELVKSELSI